MLLLLALLPLLANAFYILPYGGQYGHPTYSQYYPKYYPKYYSQAGLPQPGFGYTYGPGYNLQWGNSYPGQGYHYITHQSSVPSASISPASSEEDSDVEEGHRFQPQPSPLTEGQVRVRLERPGTDMAKNKFREFSSLGAGSVQDSQPVYVLRPFMNSKTSPVLTSLQRRTAASSLTYSENQPGVLLV